VRAEPNIDQLATLQQQVDVIRAPIAAERLRAASLDVQGTLNIAVYFHTAYAATVITPMVVAWVMTIRRRFTLWRTRLRTR
jgi:hypothetical protein